MPTKKNSTRGAIPKVLATALAQDDIARERFQSMPPSHRLEHIKYITEAKKLETQARRVEQTIVRLHREATK